MKTLAWTLLVGLMVALTGCVAPPPPKDYSLFLQYQPKSVLVLPPVNNSTDVNASYSVLTTVTRPLAERGYYVVPVVMVDHFMKENGLALPQEMHDAPLNKLYEAFGADAVLYLAIDKYGSKYQVISSNTYVYVTARLVDSRTGTMIWDGVAQVNFSGQAGLLEAVVEQVMNKLVDQAHNVAAMASYQLVNDPGRGVPKGFRHPEYAKTAP